MSEQFLGVDLKIDPETRDLVLDQLGEPEQAAGRDCLRQDLRHGIISDPAILAFQQADIQPADARELAGLVKRRAEADPRIVPGSAKGKVTQASPEGLVMELEVLPIGADSGLNLVVRLGGF